MTIAACCAQKKSSTTKGLITKLSRSEVSGLDKKLNLRLIVVVAEAYVQQNSWLATGWQILREAAPHERDCLLPAPTSNYKGCRQAELQYHTALL